jgi:type I restriction enzyme R subunit
MKLLVVVDKLLTGFDAPPCTYLYIDKSMQDHGLFQAICRTNRLDGEDKDFGYIVDYKDLFKKVENAIAVYTSELDHSAAARPRGAAAGPAQEGPERLDRRPRSLALLCEPVEPPKGELEHIHYFCGNTEIAHRPPGARAAAVALYKATVRWCAPMPTSPTTGACRLQRHAHMRDQESKLTRYLAARDHPQGQRRDPRPQGLRGRHAPPDRHLHRGRRARTISPFGNMGLLDLIVKSGIADAITSWAV